MHCNEFRRRMSAWLDGEVDAPIAAAIEGHRQECLDCRQSFEKLAAVHESMKNPASAPIPAGFAEAVMRKVRGIPLQRNKELDIKQWWQELTLPARAGIAVAAMLIMCMGGFMGTSLRPEYGLPKTAARTTSNDVAASMAQPLGEPGIETPAGAYLALTSINERKR